MGGGGGGGGGGGATGAGFCTLPGVKSANNNAFAGVTGERCEGVSSDDESESLDPGDDRSDGEFVAIGWWDISVLLCASLCFDVPHRRQRHCYNLQRTLDCNDEKLGRLIDARLHISRSRTMRVPPGDHQLPQLGWDSRPSNSGEALV